MFKFNFSEAAEQEEVGTALCEAEQPQGCTAKEVPASEARYLGLQEPVSVDGITLLKGQVTNAQAASLLGRSEVEASDLLPGQYEGGFKVWEGSLDLAQHLARLWRAGHASDNTSQAGASGAAGAQADGAAAPALAAAALAGRLAGRRVIELGCGHGLPGLVALLAGAEVHFQDYNREVLQTVTMPNVAANWDAWQLRGFVPIHAGAAVGAGQLAAPSSSGGGCSEQRGEGMAPPVRYFNGDWAALGRVLGSAGLAGGYDVALSAETIYSLESMRSLYRCILECLRRPSGVAYVAAKSFYFGVGGGTAAFLRLVNGVGEMRAQVVEVLDDGLSNKREIIRLAFVEQEA